MAISGTDCLKVPTIYVRPMIQGYGFFRGMYLQNMAFFV